MIMCWQKRELEYKMEIYAYPSLMPLYTNTNLLSIDAAYMHTCMYLLQRVSAPFKCF